MPRKRRASASEAKEPAKAKPKPKAKAESDNSSVETSMADVVAVDAEIARERTGLASMEGRPTKFLGCWRKPPKYTSELQLIAACEEYFELCDTYTIRRSYGKKKDGSEDMRDHPAPRKYSVEGLCLHLGICRDTWTSEYQKRYPTCFLWARGRIIDSIVQEASSSNASFSQFLLQNLDRANYRQKVDVDIPEGVSFSLNLAGK